MAKIDNFRVVPGVTRTSTTIDGKRIQRLAFTHKVTGELHFFSKEEIEEMQAQYWLMDGRANYDIDSATCLVVCESLAEALEYISDYGADTCIIKVEGDKQELVYSLQQAAKNILDEIEMGNFNA